MNTQQHERALVVAAGQLQGLVFDLVREINGNAAVERHARYDGDQFPELVPTPLAGLWAADGLLNRVSQEVQRHARRAREAGHTWDEIGQAHGIESGDAHRGRGHLRALRRPSDVLDVTGPVVRVALPSV